MSTEDTKKYGFIGFWACLVIIGLCMLAMFGWPGLLIPALIGLVASIGFMRGWF